MGNFEFNQTASIILTRDEVEGPCVYVYWLGNVCQYVGKSHIGLCRPAEKKHSMRNKPYDRIQIFKQSDNETADALEVYWIKKLQPIYNWVGITRAVDLSKPPYPTQDATTREWIVLSSNGAELFRCPPTEKYLATRFYAQECQRIGDEKTRELTVEREAKAHEAEDYPFKPEAKL